ncbi:hypothetical protein EVAR_75459_1 [Eumeta japonica]|uniref:Uncharacterized protein n=1 Tax=Eumeta variegata TaxID=151549 RepID=A0A4C1TN16_EUMVA|nr:hypothetical protein EVAR_75459_1 [Eumeta japonica]
MYIKISPRCTDGKNPVNCIHTESFSYNVGPLGSPGNVLFGKDLLLSMADASDTGRTYVFVTGFSVFKSYLIPCDYLINIYSRAGARSDCPMFPPNGGDISRAWRAAAAQPHKTALLPGLRYLTGAGRKIKTIYSTIPDRESAPDER